MERPPQSGIVLAYDDTEGESAAYVLKALSDEGYWIPVIATSQEPRPTHVVANNALNISLSRRLCKRKV